LVVISYYLLLFHLNLTVLIDGQFGYFYSRIDNDFIRYTEAPLNANPINPIKLKVTIECKNAMAYEKQK
jgi:hypothetical protein